ncbi:MAG: PKD domain-containing protein [Candidatus Gracilibacteria bacterium]|nr:PKD domain-containing protein [Candidatus Gracilibacteria bacterium]
MKKWFLILLLICSFGIAIPQGEAQFGVNLGNSWQDVTGRIGNWWDDLVDDGLDGIFGEGTGGPIPDGSFSLEGYEDDFSSEISAHTSLRAYIRNVLNFILSFLGIIAIAVIILAGFMYVTSLGDDGQKDKAKKILQYAVIGILIILLSYALVNTLLTGIPDEANQFGGGDPLNEETQPNPTPPTNISNVLILAQADPPDSGEIYDFPGGYVIEPNTTVVFTAQVPGYGEDQISATYWNLGNGDFVMADTVTRTLYDPGWKMVQVHGETTDDRVFDARSRLYVGEGARARFTLNNASPEIGDLITFDASSSSVPIGGIQEYNWTCTQTSPSNGTGCPEAFENATKKVQTSFSESGTYDISLTETGTLGATSESFSEVLFVSEAGSGGGPGGGVPQPDFHVPTSVELQEIISFTATGGAEDTTFAWTFPDGSTQSGRQVVFQFAAPGPRPVMLEAFDPDGEPVGDPVTKNVIVLSPGSPLAIATFEGSEILPGQDVEVFRSVSGGLAVDSASVDENGDPLGPGYTSWSVNGQVVPFAQLSQLSTQLGLYQIKLVAISPSDPNNRDSFLFPLRVLNNAPVLDPGSISVTPVEPLGPGFFQIVASAADLDGTLSKWKFEVLEFGTPVETQMLNSASGGSAETMETIVDLSALSEGVHFLQFRVTVFDNDQGQGSASVTEEITIEGGAASGGEGNQAPQAEIFVTPSTKGMTSTLFQFFTNASDPDGDFLNYSWEFPDMPPTSNPSVSHRFEEAGLHEVILTVSDGEDDTVVSQEVEILEDPEAPPSTENRPPEASFGSILPSKQGTPETQFQFFLQASDPDGDELSYSWDMGDGTEYFLQNVAHQYAQPGTYSASVRVSDGLEEVMLPLTLQVFSPDDSDYNAPPEVQISSVIPARTGDTETAFSFFLDATDPEEEDLTFSWNLGDGTTVTSQNVEEHLFSQKGQYTARVDVSDGTNTVRKTAHISVVDSGDLPAAKNLVPTAQITSITPGNSGDINTEFSFFATGSDADQDELEFSWDLGDGTTVSSKKVEKHAYAEKGTYTVTLSVSDGTDTVTRTERVRVVSPGEIIPPNTFNKPPEVQISGVTPGTSGDTDTSFSLFGTATDPEGESLTYEWNLGDGTIVAAENAQNHSYSQKGHYTATLTVSDGEKTASKNTRITVLNPGDPLLVDNHPPTAQLSSLVPGNAGDTETAFSFFATATDPEEEPLTFSWDLGDGTTASSQNVQNHSYSQKGQYTATLTVSDGENSVTRTTKITVVAKGEPIPKNTFNQPPAARISSIVPATRGDTETIFSFFSNATDPEGADLTFSWNLGDGTVLDTQNVRDHIYAQPGDYLVTLSVSDGDKTSSLTKQISVFAPGEILKGVAIKTPMDNDLSSFTHELDTVQDGYWQELQAATTPEEKAQALQKIAISDEVKRKISALETASDPAEQARLNAEIIALMDELRVLDPALEIEEVDFTEYTIRGTTNTTFFLYGQVPTEHPMPVSLQWDMGNGQVFAGQAISYQYPAPGTYRVKMTVSDGSTEAIDSLTILVESPQNTSQN